MKHLKIAILALLLIASYSNANAQDETNPWMLTIGANAIDVSTPSDANGGYFGSFNESGNDVNMIPWISRLAIARNIGKGFVLELAGSLNKIDEPWSAGESTYVGLDLNAKYDLNNAFGQTGWFDPFVYAGLGENWVGSKNGIGFNAGLGFNAWISDNVGINITTGWKKVNTPVDFEMFQHSVGLTWKFGNKDVDGDGISNKEDKCPTVAGSAEFGGCADTDTDKDGVMDCCDECPEVAGLAEFNGCPDTDGDGVQDSEDNCPKVAGLKVTHGCPDKDGDGTADKDDACPDVFGPKTNAGCPFKDTDEDGVIDLIDRCVEVPGPAKNEGCPEVFADQLSLDAALRGVNFDTGKWNIRPDAASILDRVATILSENQNLQFKFSIDGHTDNTGSAVRNMTLSNNRANSVKDYLIGKGISANRLRAQGFGETAPIDDNKTSTGRANNRRVEINEVK
ncbi:OmpA family protein [Lutibacter citreus]|uniref:OmpA family protein n=1 Tax=Lutibacter citreus TaxID=2138210 RepID=UPI001FE47BE3|nr:OmpA family protein [Lutibacter citreus]